MRQEALNNKDNKDSKDSKDKIDFISKFYCTVNKPVYYIITILSIVPFIVASALYNTSGTNIIFFMSIIVYTIAQYILYSICKNKKDIKIQRVSLPKKTMFIVSSIFAVIIILFMIAVYFSNIKEII